MSDSGAGSGEERTEPPESAQETPNPARMYDYLIGGYNNFEADRQAARRLMEVNPEAPRVMRANRAFLRRAVGFMAAQGVEQFLDIGSGVPSAGNVHEAAQRVSHEVRVVYVDSEPVAARHGEALLQDNALVSMIQADAREPQDILAHPETLRLLDFEKPVGLLMLCVLHFVDSDEAAYDLTAKIRDALPAGSYMAVSHANSEAADPGEKERVDEIYRRTTNAVTMRSRSQIQGFFGDFELQEPGLVYVPSWRPESGEDLFIEQPRRSVTLGGVARKT